MIEASEIEHLLDVGLFRTVEHRRRNWDAMAQVAAELDQAVFTERLDGFVVAIDLLEHVLERTRVVLQVIGIDRLPDLETEASACPAEVGLQNLTDVHAARHAEWVEHDVDLRAVFEERHVLDRHDLRHHALVTMTARHLVAGLDLALHSDEDLDHLHYARRQLVAALQLFDLVEEALLEQLLRLVVLLPDGLDLRHQLVVGRSEQPPLRARIFIQHRLGDLRVLLEALRAGDAGAAFEQLGETAVDVAIEDRLLVITVLGEPLDFFTLDGERALVLLDTVPIEHAHFNDRALHARRNAQRGVAHIGSFLAEDGAQKLFFRRHRAFTLRRDLADENVAGVHFRSDIDDACFVEVLERLFRYVRDVAGDFLRTELGVARHHLEFLDVDGREHVVLHDPLGEQDRVLEVVAVPWHERDEHVAPKREFTQIG